MPITEYLTEMSIRSREIIFLGSRARPVRKADNLTAVCGPILDFVRILNISHTYGTPRPITGTALLFYM
jgi:hypothetical protein